MTVLTLTNLRRQHTTTDHWPFVPQAARNASRQLPKIRFAAEYNRWSEQHAQRDVDHVAGVWLDRPVGRVAAGNRHGGLYGEREFLIEDEEVRIGKHVRHVRADLLVDHFPSPVPLFAVQLLEGLVPGTELPGVGAGFGQILLQAQQRRAKYAVVFVEVAQLPEHAVRIVLASPLLEDLLGTGESLELLRRGRLQALCVVDMFNEGLDIPAVDRVVMLRPTESKVVFLQQLGRGLRAIEGKSRLLVIDFVGNHRIFAQRLIHLLSLAGEDAGWQGLKQWLRGAPPLLPEGCLLDVELAARDLLKEFIPHGARAGIEAYRAIRDELGRRPTASELFSRGYLPKAVSKGAGDWFAFVDSEGDLSEAERQVVEAFRDWLRTVETTSLNKSYKMVVLRVLLDQSALFVGTDLHSFGRQCRRFMQDHPILRRDPEGDRHAIDHERTDDETWTAWWIKWPISRWLDKQNGFSWFRRNGDHFEFGPECSERLQPLLESLTEELVDWRLAAYSKSHGFVDAAVGEVAFEAKVSHAGGRPILFVPEKSQQPGRPVGPTNVQLPDGSQWEFKFVKVACNVAKPVGEPGNQLSDLLRGWFGPDAGLPGTDFKVLFESKDGVWHARPRGASQPSVERPAKATGNVELPIETIIDESARYTTHVPVYDLSVAAGRWGPEGVPESIGWVEVQGHRLSEGMFVAQVLGRSMEPRISDGAWCLFRPCPAGSRQGRLVLVQVNTHTDPEDGGRYTIKRYHSTKKSDDEGWQHQTIELQPLNPEYSTIHISADEADELRVRWEFVSVIRE